MTIDRIAFSPLTAEKYENRPLNSEESQEKARLIAALWTKIKTPCSDVQYRIYEKDASDKAFINLIFKNGSSKKIYTLEQDLLNQILTFPASSSVTALIPVSVSSPAAASSLVTPPSVRQSDSAKASSSSVSFTPSLIPPSSQTKEIAALQEQLSKLKKELEQTATEKETLLTQLREKEVSATAEIAKNQKEQENLKLQIKDLTDLLTTGTTTQTRLNQEIEALNKSSATITGAKEALESQLKKLTEANSTLTKELSTAASESKNLKQMLESTQRTISSTQQENTALTDIVQTQKSTAERSKEEIANLFSTLAENQTTQERLTKQIDSLRNNESRLNQTINNLQTQLASLTTENNSLQQKINELITQKQTLSTDTARLMKELDEAKSKNKEQSGTIQRLETLIKNQTKTISDLNAQLQNATGLETRIAALTQTLRAKEANETAAAKQALAQTAQIAALTTQAATDKETIANLTAQLAAKTTPQTPAIDTSSELAELRKKVGKQAQLIAQYEERLKKQTVDINDFQTRNRSLSEQLEEEARAKELIENKTKVLAATYQKLFASHQQAEHDLNEQTKKIQHLEAEIQHLKNEMNALVQIDERIESQNKLLHGENSHLKRANMIATETLQEKEQQLKVLEKRLELETLKSKKEAETQAALRQKIDELEAELFIAKGDEETYQQEISRIKGKSSPRKEELQKLEIENDRLRNTPSPTQSAAGTAAAATSSENSMQKTTAETALQSQPLSPEEEAIAAYISTQAIEGVEEFSLTPKKPE